MLQPVLPSFYKIFIFFLFYSPNKKGFSIFFFFFLERRSPILEPFSISLINIAESYYRALDMNIRLDRKIIVYLKIGVQLDHSNGRVGPETVPGHYERF